MADFSHFNEDGRATMVDVGGKNVTERVAVAVGRILVNEQCFEMIKTGGHKKGDVLGTAQIAGIMAAKKTPDIIPMCHPIMITGANIRFNLNEEDLAVEIEATVKCSGVTGVEISKLVLDDGSKVAYAPYTNVKFGMKSGIGSPINSNDFPLMRVEEMILVEIEGLAKSGQESAAKTKLESFVKTYRDPNYTVEAGGRTLDNEIWYQRRVELWGEGFATSDMMRLNKPLVRFHDNNPGSFPDAHAFNMPANDPWRLLRFPQTEMNTNAGIIDNEGGEQPVPGQNAGLRDGVTD